MSNKLRRASGLLLEDLIQLVARSRQQSHEFLERYGVTVPQSGVLRVLQKSGPLPIGTLADKLYLKTSTVSGIIDRLERAHMVARNRGNTGDRRVVQVELTDAGATMAAKLPDTSFDLLRRAIDRLEPIEVKNLRTSLSRLLELIQEEDSNSS